MLSSCAVTQNYNITFGISGLTGTANFNSFNCEGFQVNPPPLEVSISVSLNPVNEKAQGLVTFKSPSGNISYTVSAEKTGDNYSGRIETSSTVFSVTTPSGGTGQGAPITCGRLTLPQPNILINNVTLPANIPELSNYYVPNDQYNINLLTCNNSNPAATITFIRNLQMSINTDLVNDFTGGLCIGCSCIYPNSTCGASACNGNVCQNVVVPRIQTICQTKIDGSDIAEAIFVVCDEYSYSKGCQIPDNTCRVRYVSPDQIVQTRFDECCPYMVSVVRGRGKTLKEKLQYIYNLENSRIGVTFETFYKNMMLYGMAKYILSKLLFCKFNINYLLGKYNERFLESLGDSRFCAFKQLFLDCESPVYGYQRYFKSGHHH
jgi:hypothetical protein